MARIALASVRSCGVTTAAAGLAMAWTAKGPTLLVESDPAGGTLAAACCLPSEPGLVSLAAAARRRADPALILDHCQQLADGTPVLTAPASPERARSALSMTVGLLARLGELDADVFIDCGRLEDAAAPNTRLFAAAEVALLLSRPTLPDLSSLAAHLEARGTSARRPLVALVGRGPYPPAEVEEGIGVEVAGTLPWDREAAEAMPATPPGARHLTRSPLVRALRSLSDELLKRLPAPAAATAANEQEDAEVPA